jgi:hypothetical protein
MRSSGIANLLDPRSVHAASIPGTIIHRAGLLAAERNNSDRVSDYL